MPLKIFWAGGKAYSCVRPPKKQPEQRKFLTHTFLFPPLFSLEIPFFPDSVRESTSSLLIGKSYLSPLFFLSHFRYVIPRSLIDLDTETQTGDMGSWKSYARTRKYCFRFCSCRKKGNSSWIYGRKNIRRLISGEAIGGEKKNTLERRKKGNKNVAFSSFIFLNGEIKGRRRGVKKDTENAGVSEIRFCAPPPPPRLWYRSFIWCSQSTNTSPLPNVC